MIIKTNNVINYIKSYIKIYKFIESAFKALAHCFSIASKNRDWRDPVSILVIYKNKLLVYPLHSGLFNGCCYICSRT